MQFKIKISTLFTCSLERAFKTPMLCDISKIHTGFLLMPRITHSSEDHDWGKPGSTKKIHASKSLTQKGGFISTDKILERIENKYWKIEVSDFQSWILGFYKFIGEWETIPMESNLIQVDYTYTLYSRSTILYPLNWLFAKIFWKKYMTKVLKNIKTLVNNKEKYQYA